MAYRLPLKKIILLFAICYLLFAIVGCQTTKEIAKGFVGVSTEALEEERKSAVAETFNYDYFTCYTKTLDILKNMGAYIYAQNIKEHMIAIYVSEEDTTPAGIFFNEIDANTTQIEISSQSTYAKEFISQKLFSELKKKE